MTWHQGICLGFEDTQPPLACNWLVTLGNGLVSFPLYLTDTSYLIGGTWTYTIFHEVLPEGNGYVLLPWIKQDTANKIYKFSTMRILKSIEYTKTHKIKEGLTTGSCCKKSIIFSHIYVYSPSLKNKYKTIQININHWAHL